MSCYLLNKGQHGACIPQLSAALAVEVTFLSFGLILFVSEQYPQRKQHWLFLALSASVWAAFVLDYIKVIYAQIK